MEKLGVRLLITDNMSRQEKMENYEFFVRHFGFELYFQINKSSFLSKEDKQTICLEDCIEYTRNKVKPSSILYGEVDMTCVCTEEDIHNFLHFLPNQADIPTFDFD